MAIELYAIIGCSKNTTVINEIAKLRIISGTHTLLINLIIIHIRDIIVKSINGNKAIRNSFKIEFEGKEPVISKLVANQSNDKKD